MVLANLAAGFAVAPRGTVAVSFAELLKECRLGHEDEAPATSGTVAALQASLA